MVRWWYDKSIRKQQIVPRAASDRATGPQPQPQPSHAATRPARGHAVVPPRHRAGHSHIGRGRGGSPPTHDNGQTNPRSEGCGCGPVYSLSELWLAGRLCALQAG